MENFIFYNPTKIVFGKGTIGELSHLIPPKSRVLLCYGGGSIKKNGVYDQVKEATKGFELFEFSGIEPNPLFETLMKGVELIEKERIDFLLPVGGGSVLDGTKFMAAAACFNGDPWDILAKHATVEEALPIGAVLTLPATGSESNGNSVVSRRESQEKLAFSSPLLFPRFSVLDPETTYSLPENQLRNGLIDTYIHTMEQYGTYSAEAPLQERQAEAILQTVIEIAPHVIESKEYNIRASFVWCATQALNMLIGCGVPNDWSTHAIGHELTAFYGLAHGETLAIVHPRLLAHQFESKKERLAQYGRRVWGIEGSEEEVASAAIEKTEEFFRSIGTKTTLKEYNIDSKEAAGKVYERFKARGTVLGERQDITPEKVRAIIEAC